MATFSRAYHFLYKCPLRRIDTNPLETSNLGDWLTKYGLDAIMNGYRSKNYADMNTMFAAKVIESERKGEYIYSKGLLVETFNTAAINTSLYAKSRTDESSQIIGNFTHNGMDAIVHIVNKKLTGLTELLWFNMEPKLPDLTQQNVLSIFVQWNARAYELAYERRPYQLVVYYPVIGDSVQYIYNPIGGLDIIAGLIDMDVLPARPIAAECLQCKACSEHLRMI